jgi:hypothetical protein
MPAARARAVGWAYRSAVSASETGTTAVAGRRAQRLRQHDGHGSARLCRRRPSLRHRRDPYASPPPPAGRHPGCPSHRAHGVGNHRNPSSRLRAPSWQRLTPAATRPGRAGFLLRDAPRSARRGGTWHGSAGYFRSGAFEGADGGCCPDLSNPGQLSHLGREVAVQVPCIGADHAGEQVGGPVVAPIKGASRCAAMAVPTAVRARGSAAIAPPGGQRRQEEQTHHQRLGK